MNYFGSNFAELHITCEEDCGNSPKKILLKAFNIANAKNDVEFTAANLTDQVRWNRVGKQVVEGKDHVISAINQWMESAASELHIKNIITHGSTGAVNGTLILANKRSYEFCHVYNFTGASKDSRIREITSFVIPG